MANLARLPGKMFTLAFNALLDSRKTSTRRQLPVSQRNLQNGFSAMPNSTSLSAAPNSRTDQ